MKRTLLLLTFICFTGSLFSQKVDSIKVEQSGDFIKIRYKILKSTPDQLFRIKIVYSVNGGLNIEPRSITGDVGDNIVGGKPEYFAVWDVLKDVDELKSAEFIVRAELISDLTAKALVSPKSKKVFGNNRACILIVSEFPGPKSGLKIGYLGSFGLAIRAGKGRPPLTSQYKTTYDNLYHAKPESRPVASLDITKRIVNGENFQMHLLAGFENSDLLVYNTGGTSPQFWFHGVDGFEIGLLAGYKHIAGSFMVSKLNTGKNEDSVTKSASPDVYVNIGLGVRF